MPEDVSIKILTQQLKSPVITWWHIWKVSIWDGEILNMNYYCDLTLRESKQQWTKNSWRRLGLQAGAFIIQNANCVNAFTLIIVAMRFYHIKWQTETISESCPTKIDWRATRGSWQQLEEHNIKSSAYLLYWLLNVFAEIGISCNSNKKKVQKPI